MTIVTPDDPTTLNTLAAQAMAAPAPVRETTTVDESSLELPDLFVELPGGYLGDDVRLVTEAEIRELNGHDEEAIAKSKDMARALLTILERGTVKIGDEKATRKVMDGLLMGDRDALLLAIYRATFGNKVPVERACTSCLETQTLTVDLVKDVPMVKFEDAMADRFFTVKCRVGEVYCTLPSGVTHREMLTNTDHSVAEMNTKLLAACIQTINGLPALGEADAKKLGIKDRGLITEEIGKRNPGPRLDKVQKACPSCGDTMEVPLSITALFRI
jgi:hypothetical protein